MGKAVFVAYERGTKAFKEGLKPGDNPVDATQYKELYRWWNLGYNDMKVISVGRFKNRMEKLRQGKSLND